VNAAELQPIPVIRSVTATLAEADAVIGASQLRAMAQLLYMPDESRELLRRIAKALEGAK
jgi:hypothetical protein